MFLWSLIWNKGNKVVFISLGSAES